MKPSEAAIEAAARASYDAARLAEAVATIARVEAVLMRWSEDIVRLPFDERLSLRRARVELRAALNTDDIEAGT